MNTMITNVNHIDTLVAIAMAIDLIVSKINVIHKTY